MPNKLDETLLGFRLHVDYSRNTGQGTLVKFIPSNALLFLIEWEMLEYFYYTGCWGIMFTAETQIP